MRVIVKERLAILTSIVAKHAEHSTLRLQAVKQRNDAERKRLIQSQEFLRVGMALHNFGWS